GGDVVPVSLDHGVPELRIEKQLPCERELQELSAAAGALDPAEEHGLLRGLIRDLVLRRQCLPGRLGHAPSIGSLPRSVKDTVRARSREGKRYRRKDPASLTEARRGLRERCGASSRECGGGSKSRRDG